MEFAFVGSSTETEWRNWHERNVEVDDMGGVQLAQERFPTYVAPMPIMGKMPRAFTAVDIDLDAYGSLYVLSGVGNLFRHDQGGRVHYLPYPRLDEEEFGDPTALHVRGGLLYVAYSRRDSENGSKPHTGHIQAVDLTNLETLWTKKNTVEERQLERPRRIVEGLRTQTVYALDEETWEGVRLGLVVTVGTDGTITPVVEGLRRAEDIAVDRTGALYVLAYDTPVDGDEPIPVVWRFDADDLHELEDPISPSSRNKLLEVRINDPVRIEIVDEEELLLGVGPDTSNEAVLFRYLRRQTSESETASFSVERLTSFRRSSHRLLLARGRTKGGEGLYVIDSDQRRIHFLPETRQNRRKKRTSEDDQQLQTDYTAQLVKRFDSGVAETHWHRVKLGLGLDRLDPSTQVRLSYYATDGPVPISDIDEIRGIGSVYAGQLRDADVEDVSELVRRSPEEIADATTAGLKRTRRWDDQAWNHFEEWWRKNSYGLSEPNPRDALLDAAVGRYLWVSLELTGSEFTSPRLNSFRAYFPKQSYLRYLPAIYREDERSAAFLERFLSVFETVFVDIEEGIEEITQILDAGGAPAPYLTWLQRWMAIETDETWSEAARREFLSKAPALFKARGTRSGLIELLRIYLEVYDPRPSNDETRSRVYPHSQVERTSTGETIGIDSTALTPNTAVGPYVLEHPDLDGIDNPITKEGYERFLDCPQCYLVLLGITVDDEQARTVQRILEAERPAHTTGRAVELRPMTQLGSHTYLGLNTVLSSREFVLGRTGLGEGSILLERDGDHQTNT